MSTDLAETADAPPPPPGPGIVTVLWRRKAYLVFGAIVGLGLGYLDYLRRDRVYQSTAQVYVQKRRIDPIQQPGLTGGLGSDSRVAFIDDFLATQEALIRSSVVLVKAGSHLEEASLEKPPPSGDRAAYIGSGLTVSRVQTGVGTSANILNISFRGPSSPDCEAAVNAVIAAYTDTLEGGVEKATKGDLDQIRVAQASIHSQLEKLDGEFATAHNAVLAKSTISLADLKSRVSQTEDKKYAQQQRQREIQKQLDKVDEARKRKAEPAAILAMLRAYREIGPERPTVGGPAETARPAESVRPADDQLAALRNEERKLLREFGKDHPKVIEVRQQIADLEQARLEQARTAPRPAPKTAPDEVEDAISRILLGLTQELELVQERIKSFDEEILDKDRPVIGALEGLQFKETSLADRRDRLRKQLGDLDDREKQITLTQQTRVYDVRTINPAGPGVKVAPVLMQSLMMAIVLGLAAGGGLAYLAEYTDKSFRTPEEIRRRLGLAVVGHIPSLTPSAAGAVVGPVDARVVVYHRPKSTESESYRGVRTALYFSTRGKGHQVIQVTSPNPGDGKSTLSANLAVAIAQSGKRVVLVDCDFRKPKIHKIFGVSPEVGLASVIAGDADLARATQASGIPNLSLIVCGPRPANPAELLTSQRFVEVLDEIKKGYDFVLIDTPPLLAVSDPAVVAPRVDGVLLTIRITSRTRPAAERARETLAALGANVVGVVVNNVQGTRRGGGNYGYGYGYGYGYSYGYGYQYRYNYAYGYAENYGDAVDDSGEFPAVNGSLPGPPAPRHLT